MSNGCGCKGVCDRYKATGSPFEGRYRNGQKRCKGCVIYIRWDGLFCPCCGVRLRSHPRNKKYKGLLVESQKKKEKKKGKEGKKT